MNIVTRPQWGARTPDPRPFPNTAWANRTGFTVHYSAANKNQTVRSIQNYQMDHNKWRDIGYNFLVRHDGTIYEGAQGTWTAVGAHVAGHNGENIGVCAIGTDADITDVQKRSIRWLYDEACRRAGRALAMRYHSQYANNPDPGDNVTSCPGNNLRAWVKAGMPVPGDPPQTEGGDMSDAYNLLDDLHRVEGNDTFTDPDHPEYGSLSNSKAIAAIQRAQIDAHTAKDNTIALLAKVDQLLARPPATFTDAQIDDLAQKIGDRLAAEPDVPLNDDDKPTIIAAVKQALREGAG